MNKNVIIGLIVAGVLVLGGAAWYLTSSNSSDSDDGQSSTVSAEEISDFINPYDQAVTMTGTITDSADPSSDSTVIMQYKDNNTWAISVDGTEGKTQFINIGDYSYMYSSETDSWFRMPSSTDTDSPFDDFKIDKDEIQTLKDNAVVVGKSGCTLGTCEVYDMTDPDTGDKTTLKIGSGGRIAEMSGTSGTTSTTMVFDYSGPINIETPADYQEFNIPN